MNRIEVHTTKHRAFTIVEIMIIVAILALLAAIAVPNFLRARDRSLATKEMKARNIQTFVEDYPDNRERDVPRLGRISVYDYTDPKDGSKHRAVFNDGVIIHIDGVAVTPQSK